MFHKVGGADALKRDGDRLHSVVDGRYVTVVQADSNRLYCLDSTCYHAGGPLGIGDIEQVLGETCITCPWHSYQVSLKDGSKFYQSMEMGPNKKLVPGPWRKKENAQRVHIVERRADGIYVKLSEKGAYDSDTYGTSSVCGIRAQGSQASENKIHSSLPKRSGHVLNPSFAPKRHVETPLATSFSELEEDKERGEWDTMLVCEMEKQGPNAIKLSLNCASPNETERTLKSVLPLDFVPTSITEVLDAKHVRLGLMSDDGEIVSREYTPIHSMKRTRSTMKLEFCIRIYENGPLTSRLAKLNVGDQIFVGRQVPSKRPVSLQRDSQETIFLFGAGSGITPMLQILDNAVDFETTNPVKFKLVCTNLSESTAIGYKVVDDLREKLKDKLDVYYFFTSGDDAGAAAGRPNTFTGIRSTTMDAFNQIDLPSIAKATYVSCGPSSFMEALKEALINKLRKSPETLLEYI